MDVSPLAVDRIEFLKIQVASNPAWKGGVDKNFPQLLLDTQSTVCEWRSSLDYGDEELSDPRHFVFSFGLRVQQAAQKKGAILPYEIEVEVMVFLRFAVNDIPPVADRFRVIRANGYPIAYAAIREMICNCTGRGTHGVWQLPSVNFSKDAVAGAVDDETARLKRIAAMNAKPVRLKSAPSKAVTSPKLRSKTRTIA